MVTLRQQEQSPVPKIGIVFCLGLLAAGAFAQSAADQSDVALPIEVAQGISVTQPTYFQSVNSEDVVVDPGAYRVLRWSENALALVPQDGGEAIRIQAATGGHDESLSTPEAYIIGEEDSTVRYIILLLPDGATLEARGLIGGVAPRGRIVRLERTDIKKILTPERLQRIQDYESIQRPPIGIVTQQDPDEFEITSASPTVTEPGATLTINGSGFTKSSTVVVEFSNNASPPIQNQSAQVVSKTNTQLVVKVPPHPNTGPIRVQVGRAFRTSAFDIVVKRRPQITYLEPKRALPGDIVELRGYNIANAQTKFHDGVNAFGGSVGTVVDANGVPIVHDKGSLHYRRLPVPNGAITGPIFVVNVDGAFLTEVFEVAGTDTQGVRPVITDLVPHDGNVGTVVTLHGTFESAANDTFVYFGGRTLGVNPSFSDGNTLRVTVPAGAETGRIRVRSGNFEAESKESFYLPPAVSGFYPPAAPVGYTMKVYGTNFEKSHYTVWDMNVVRFNGIPARIRWVGSGQPPRLEEDYIDVDVPAGFTSGRITVQTPGGIATSQEVFTVNQ